MASLDKSDLFTSTVTTDATVHLVMVPIVAMLTVVTNGVFIITLIKKKSLHTPSNILLGALALSDVLVAVVAEPLWMVNLSFTSIGEESTTFESVNNSLVTFQVALSFFYIATISLDRHMAVFYPFWYHAHATCKSHIIIAIAVIVLSIILKTPLTVIARIELTIASYIFIAKMFIAIIIACYCNWKIFGLIQKQMREINAAQTTTTRAEVRSSVCRRMHEKNKAVIVIIIAMSLILCYMPFMIVIFMQGIGKTLSASDARLSLHWTVFLVLLNSLVNPIVYYARMKSFRKAAKELICKRRGEISTASSK